MRDDRKFAIVVSDRPEGIREWLEKAGFEVTVKNYESWEEGYRDLFGVHLIVLDEVNCRGRGHLEPTMDAEEALRQSQHGPFVLILVSDNDRHLDEHVKHHGSHPRQIVHTHSDSLLALAQQIHAASWRDDPV